MSFTWDAARGRYRDASGRLVPDAQVRSALDVVLRAQAEHMRDLTRQLQGGTLTLGDWQRQMMQSVKHSHLIGTSLAGGGWQQMTQADFGWAGQRIRSQYAYLDRFARDVAAGRQSLTGAPARAEMYADAARTTHRAASRRLARRMGREQERNVLGVADHCAGCLAQNARGWVDLGELVPPGLRQCRARCHCSLRFRTQPAA